MHEQHEIEYKLKKKAKEISKIFGETETVIILAGNKKTGIPRCMIGSSFKRGRLREIQGILETAKQILTLKHFNIPPFQKR
jgi:hypothetical protein